MDTLFIHKLVDNCELKLVTKLSIQNKQILGLQIVKDVSINKIPEIDIKKIKIKNKLKDS